MPAPPSVTVALRSWALSAPTTVPLTESFAGSLCRLAEQTPAGRVQGDCDRAPLARRHMRGDRAYRHRLVRAARGRGRDRASRGTVHAASRATVRRSAIVQLPAACGRARHGTLTVRPATRGVPTWVSEIAPSPPAGTVTNALVALALPPALVAVTRHCRWWETSALAHHVGRAARAGDRPRVAQPRVAQRRAARAAAADARFARQALPERGDARRSRGAAAPAAGRAS